jgi:hypothetical protein
MLRLCIVERKPTEGKNRQYSVREDINVEDTNMIGGEGTEKKSQLWDEKCGHKT